MLSIIGGTVTLCTENGTPLSQQHAFQAIYKWYMFWAEGLYCVDHIYLHWITASSIDWLQEPLSILQLSNQRCWVDARIGCLGCTEDLPAGHSKWPLCKISVLQSTISIRQQSKLWSRDKPNHSRVIRSWTHHVCFLREYSISQTL